MSPWIMARVVWATASCSTATLWESTRNKLTAERADVLVTAWARRLLAQVEATVELTGREHIQSGETYVVMSNHQSLYDIPALFAALPIRIRMVAKAELFKIPLWSRAMLVSGFVPVHRGDSSKALSDLKLAKDALLQGTNIWIAPEGTRSPDGQLLPFKPGGFHLATACGVRILPVTIHGTRMILPSQTTTVQLGQKVQMTVGAPIDPKQFGRKKRNELMQAVKDAIEAPLLRQG